MKTKRDKHRRPIRCLLLALGLIFGSRMAAQAQIAPAAPVLAAYLKLSLGVSRELVLPRPALSVASVAPEVVTATLRGPDRLVLTALTIGETPVILSFAGERATIYVEVVGQPLFTSETFVNPQRRPRPAARATRGSYAVSYTPALGGALPFLRQSFTLQRDLKAGRTLRADGEFFNFFGSGQGSFLLPPETKFGINRISLGLQDKTGTAEFLDSDLQLSRLDFRNYLIRGPHFTAAPGTRWYGADIFAGIVQPIPRAFSGEQGFIVGGVVPVWRRPQTLLVRAGAVALFPRAANRPSLPPEQLDRDGKSLLLHTDARYDPDKRTTLEGAVDFARGAFSWYGNARAQRGKFLLLGEALRTARNFPLFQIGAQPGGSRLLTGTVQWVPSRQWTFFASYLRNDADLLAFGNSGASLRSRSLSASAGYSPNAFTRYNLSYARNALATSLLVARNVTPSFISQNLQAVAGNYTRIFSRWSNDASFRLTRNRDTQFQTPLENGIYARDELRRNTEHGYVSGYVAYTRNTRTLDALLLRQPELLPPNLRYELETNPRQFLSKFRAEALLVLEAMNANDRRRTNTTEIGTRWQGNYSRLSASGEARYAGGTFFGSPQSSILSAGSVNMRLDAANTFGVSAARYQFLNRNNLTRSTLTFNYSYRFGNGDGPPALAKLLGITRLFGASKGELAGRVYYDVNANGQEDPTDPGVPDAVVTLDYTAFTTRTDAEGRYRFASVPAGTRVVSVRLDTLGVSVRAVTPVETPVTIGRKPATVSFGITDRGFLAGRVFNDVNPADINKGPGLAAPTYSGIAVISTTPSG